MNSEFEKEDASHSKEWPTEGLENVKNCPICNTEERLPLYVELTDLVFRCAPGRWDMYRCIDCQTVYLDPRPSSKTIHLAYRNYYTHTQPLSENQIAQSSFFRRLKQSFANGYMNRRYASKFRPSLLLGGILIGFIPQLRERLDRRMRYLPLKHPNAKLLDVGFGNGSFLIQMKDAGWDVYGVDSDHQVVESAKDRGLNVECGGIEALLEEREKFDAITLSHVIEHVYEPLKTIRIAYSLLKTGGCLYLETPNIESIGHRVFEEHWRGLEVPRHLTIFSWLSLETLLRDAGFTKMDKIVQKGIYKNLAGKSRALKRGLDPYENNCQKIWDGGIEFVADFASRLNRRNSEFIAIRAWKN